MSWTSKYAAGFTRPLVRQLVAVVQRDQRAALDFVGGAGALPGFVSYLIANMPIQQFPMIMITPQEENFNRDAVGSLHSTAKILVVIAVSHQDRAVLAESTQDYVRAVDAILNSLDLTDLYASLPLALPHLAAGTMTDALVAGTVKDLFVESHGYDEIRKKGDSFFMVAAMNLIVDREET